MSLPKDFHRVFQITDLTDSAFLIVHYKLSFRIVDCVIIHRNIDIGIRYFPKKYSMFTSSAKTTSYLLSLKIDLTPDVSARRKKCVKQRVF